MASNSANNNNSRSNLAQPNGNGVYSPSEPYAAHPATTAGAGTQPHDHSRQHTHTHIPTRREHHHQDATAASAKPEAEEQQPPTEQQQPPRRTPSMLARMGIAPIDFVPAAQASNTVDGSKPFAADNMPPRSPVGAVRRNSALMNKQIAPKDPATAGTEAAPAAAAVDIEYPWHKGTAEEVFSQLGTDEGGLTSTEAAKRLMEHGRNEITPPPQPGIVYRYLCNLVGPFSLMLLGGGTLAFIIVIVEGAQQSFFDKQTFALGCVLWGVAFLTSLFQTWMENASDKLMDALRALTAETAWVLRDGELKEIKGAEIVPGDIVKIKMGEKVPADIRIIAATDLKVNNASLTGENMDVKLGLEAKAEICFQAKNVAWSGCAFTNGYGTGVVFATGDQTTFGKVAKAAVDAEKPDTLMRREVRRLILIMSICGTVMSLAFAGAALGTHRGWIAAGIVLVGLFTANIPEGLLPQITIALTITARRMYHRHVVVSNLEIIETLGAVSVICSDKTGTLTTNKMTVSHMVYDGKIHMAPSAPVLPEDEVLEIDPKSQAASATIRNAALNSDAIFVEKPSANIAEWSVRGDASEAALIRFVQERQDLEETRKQYPRLTVIPFNSKKKWMASVVKVESGKQLVLMKGAAERVLERCDKMLTTDGEIELPVDMKEQLNERILDLASRGERVLAFAQAEVQFPDDYKFEADGDDVNFPLDHLAFCGLISLVDPPRPTVKGAIAACHKAGIHVIMVTGDHPVTALAISRALGLITLPTLEEAGDDAKPEDCAAMVTGEMMLHFQQEDWDRVLSCREHVFARVQPEQKQQLVWRLNERGHIVAMTGDGVNDAPALKAANVGVAVGSGTMVAKEAAQIVITDDDFTSIVVGVREGRQIFDNLKKAVTYIITHLCPETLPFIFNFAIGIPLAMETIVIILIDLGTDMLPGIALAYEIAEDRIMEIPPRSGDDHLIAPRMLVLGWLYTGFQETFFCYWAFYYTFYHYGFTFQSTVGADTGYRSTFAELDSDYQEQYRGMCRDNFKHRAEFDCESDAGMEPFMVFMNEVVSSAQAAYFITLVTLQFANLLNRRNQTMSVFSPRQQLNWRMFVSIAISVAFMVCIVYIPGLNEAFYLEPVRSELACSALWGIPVMILLEETRKFLVRQWPQGFVARWTLY